MRPAGFHAKDWGKYIQLDKQRDYLCRPCFDQIKALIDAGGCD